VKRRFFLAGSLVSVATLGASGQRTAAQEPHVPELSVEEWMSAWMEKKAAQGVLHLSRFKEPIYFLLKPITWVPEPQQRGYSQVTAPQGFVTDFASIPRVFWSALRPDGDYTYPAIIHDYLYWTQRTTREEADQILRFGMEDFGIDSLTIRTIYNAVRVGGSGAWADNARAKQTGERRVLRDFPSDPTISWSEWKSRRDRFAEAE
jgi:Protein of unknown function (DUF1353)